MSLEDDTKEELRPGGVAMIPPGLVTWVTGDEPVIGIDFILSGRKNQEQWKRLPTFLTLTVCTA